LALARLNSAKGSETIAIGKSREPIWPSGIVGSISHNSCLASAVILPQQDASGIGIDIETVIRGEAQDALLGLVVSSAELDYLRTCDSPLPSATLLTLAFSAKESLYKGAFGAIGRFFDFGAARVSCIDIKNGTLSLTLTEDLSPLFHRNSTWIVDFAFLQADTVATSFVWKTPSITRFNGA
jgi:enterobactin synthetase component D